MKANAMGVGYKVETTALEGGEIRQEVNYHDGDVVTNVTRQILKTKEAQTRAMLIKMGWTPPGEQGREEMVKIGHLIATQDNRITDAPIFIVQQKVRDYGYDGDHSFDGYEWINPDNGHTEATTQQAKRLDALAKGYRDTAPWERVYYKDRWEFVTACFTEQGCMDYLRINGHNLKEPRIYAEGSYRNNEYRAVREFLKGMAQAT